jgi:hypothetical protein
MCLVSSLSSLPILFLTLQQQELQQRWFFFSARLAAFLVIQIRKSSVPARYRLHRTKTMMMELVLASAMSVNRSLR